MFWTKKAWWKSLLEVTKRERAGLISLCLLLGILGWVTQRYRKYEQKEAVNWSVQQMPNAAVPTKISVNSAPRKGWDPLPPRTRNWNHAQKGWNQRYDSKRTYSKTSVNGHVIGRGGTPSARYPLQGERSLRTHTGPRPRSIEVNQADSLDWLQLPGIGPLYTRRILRFREKLGGFHTISQVKETFGLPDSTFQQIESYLELRAPPKPWINLNSADKETLSAHPYISQTLARHIIAYRQQHGGFRQVDELRQVRLVSDSVWGKLSPYIIIN